MWNHDKGKGFKLLGEETRCGFFTSKQWQLDINIFIKEETGEIKLFSKNRVEKVGIDNILKSLNSPLED